MAFMFVLLIDKVDALSFSSVSNRVTYQYMDGTYIDKAFYPDNTWILPAYVNSSMGEPYIQLYQFRYTLSSNFLKTRTYTMKINWQFKDFNSGGGTIDLSDFRLALPLQDFGCGTSYSNTTPDNLTLISNDFTYSNSNGTVEWTIKFKPKVDTCNFLSGIFYHESNNNNYAIINNYNTGDANSRLIITPSYTYVESADNSDIIANNNQNTQQIIDNNNSNTQDIIDSQDKINDNLTDDTPPDTDNFISNLQGLVNDSPIATLILMPFTLLNRYIEGFSGNCSSINLGNLYGTDLTLSCINVSSIVGSDLWSIIDGLVSIFMIYNIAMLFVSVFNDITSLRDTFDSLYTPQHAKTLGKHTSEVS